MLTKRDSAHFWAGQFLILTIWNAISTVAFATQGAMGWTLFSYVITVASFLAARREWRKGSWFRKQGIP